MIKPKKIRLSWLKQSQYEKIFQKDIYQNENIPHYQEHPISIYQNPLDGIRYFLDKNSLKKCLFPRRIGYAKNYVWKKNNFTTKFPKNNPIVQYIIATTTDKQFKMISVKYLKQPCDSIFCLIRKNQDQANCKENIHGTPIKSNQHIETIQKQQQQKTSEKMDLVQNQRCFVSEILKQIYPIQHSKFIVALQSSQSLMQL